MNTDAGRTKLAVSALVFAVVLAFSYLPAPTAASENETTALRAEKGDALFAALGRSKSRTEARSLENAIWMYWMHAPNSQAQNLLDQALKRRSAYDFAGAVEILDELVVVAPQFAEGWNQRATLRYLQEKYEDSLADIEQVLKFEPRHFGALAGKAQILMLLGRFEQGQKALQRAVDIHPWLRGRGALIKVPEEDA